MGKYSFKAILFLAMTTVAHMAAGQVASDLLLRSSTYNGANLPPSFNNKLDLALSSDGVRWQRISTNPVLSAYSRDASIAKHSNEFVTVYTDAFNSTNGSFGFARSRNLVNWTATNIRLKGPLLSNAIPNNVWAPEWFVEGTNYYVVVRLSTTGGNNYGPPGIGYTQCLNPGEWTEWTDFAAMTNLNASAENDPFILKIGTVYHLFTDHSDFGGPGVHAILHRTSTNGPFTGYSPPTNIATNFLSAPAFLASGIRRDTAWEGQFVLPTGSNNYRLYFQAALTDMCFSIDSTDAMTTWDPQSMRQLTYDGSTAYGHGSVLPIGATEGLPMAAAAAFVARTEGLAATTIAQVQASPQTYGLYSVADYQANRLAGRSDVTTNPLAYGLYTASSIMDLNLGGIVLQKNGGTANVSLRVLTTTNLNQGFTNNPTNIVFPVDLPGDKQFLRVRAAGLQ